MATPTHKELLEGSTVWRKTHRGVTYLLNHHGYRENPENPYDDFENHPGIWCYYLLIPEQMFPHRWTDFECVRGDHGFESVGPAWQHDWFDTEITFSENQPQYCRHTDRVWGGVKIGCDYAHLWHRDQGYPDTYESVARDARQTVDKFLEANPDRRLQSEYSHLWGEKEDFYTAKNGRLIHKDDKVPEDWVSWHPADGEEVA